MYDFKGIVGHTHHHVSTFLEIMSTEGKVWKHSVLSKSEFDKSLKSIPSNLKFGNSPAMEFIRQNKATILAVSYSSFSDPAIESFLASIPNSVPKIGFQPIINPLKWILWSKLLMKKSNFIVHRGDLPSAIEIFGMENKYAGYIYLIDSSGFIRWKAAGPATAEELEELKDKIKFLTNL